MRRQFLLLTTAFFAATSLAEESALGGLRDPNPPPFATGSYPNNPLNEEAASSPYLSSSHLCGTSAQANNQPTAGRTMCGRAVAQMVRCMAKNLLADPGKCTGACGHGMNFVDCTSGQMEACGYEKISSFLDRRCSMPGAVLAYGRHSETKRGSRYGHVEFVCGPSQYCSIYSYIHDRPWPKPVPDACWYPKQKETIPLPF